MKSRYTKGFFCSLFVCFSLIKGNVLATNLPEEVMLVRQKFVDTVDHVVLPDEYEKFLVQKAKDATSQALDTFQNTSQYFLLVDRNPKSQVVSLAFFDAGENTIVLVGSSKTSTGNPKRLGYYETPTGVFRNLPQNMSYRALGTRNERGWRGLGVKGSRIWDLGWQTSKHHKGGPIDIRMLVHATDPDQGEKRLGTRDSQGCVRISAKLNYFLDHYGILDTLYEKSEKAKWVLAKNRDPVTLAGSLVVVVDSESK